VMLLAYIGIFFLYLKLRPEDDLRIRSS
jgi:hypothetical protein